MLKVINKSLYIKPNQISATDDPKHVVFITIKMMTLGSSN